MSNYNDVTVTNSRGTTINPKSDNGTYDKAAWVEQKKTERENAFKMVEETATQIARDGKALIGYLDVQSRFDRYSVSNALLIFTQRPEATRLGDFNLWKENEAFIKKGEAGIVIIEPGEQYKRGDGSRGVKYNVKKVFDVLQTTMEPVPETKIVHDEKILIRALMSDAPVAINANDKLPENMPAIYMPETKEILIRPGLTESDLFRALSQELAHVEMNREGYSRKECAHKAYCSAYIICKRSGIDVSGFNFTNFPAHYKDMSSRDVRNDLSKIRDAANAVTSRMARVLEPGKTQYKKRDEQSR